MGEVAQEGRTVLFVSHNMAAIQNLCTEALWLDSGRVSKSGVVADVVQSYLQLGIHQQIERTWDVSLQAGQSDLIALRSAKVVPLDNSKSNIVSIETPLRFEFECWNGFENSQLNFSIVLSRVDGLEIFNTTSQARYFQRGWVRGSFEMPGNFLNDGSYSIRVLVVRDMAIALIDLKEVLTFEVAETQRESSWYGRWVGAVRPKFDWTLSFQNTH